MNARLHQPAPRTRARGWEQWLLLAAAVLGSLALVHALLQWARWWVAQAAWLPLGALCGGTALIVTTALRGHAWAAWLLGSAIAVAGMALCAGQFGLLLP